MTAPSSDAQTRFLLIAVVWLVLAALAIKWVGRSLRSQLGPGARRKPARDFSAAMVADVPPALVKRALERGLVTPAQMAGMSDEERRFVFASLQAKLAEPAPDEPVSGARRPGNAARPPRPSAR